jgi:pimeloyl-ACP methyl ester carboxylesterase
MRAAAPFVQGDIDRNGLQLHYEVYGQGSHTILFIVPWWPLIDSRCFKSQIPYFSEHFRCVTYDPIGNGKSDHATDPEVYGIANHIDNALAVLDEVGAEKATVFGLSCAGSVCFGLAAFHPERVEAIVTVGTVSPLATPHSHRPAENYTAAYAAPVGWQKYNRTYWRENFSDFADFFSREMYNEPHSSKQIEDTVDWASQTVGEALIAANDGPTGSQQMIDEAAYKAIQCPLLLIHGDRDRIIPVEASEIVARLTGGQLVILPESGHGPHARIPAKVNLLTRDFLARHLDAELPDTVSTAEVSTRRKKSKTKKALYLSSPIGLGHVRRDLAISRELRGLHPDLKIEWLAQDPVTRFLSGNSEHIHPASAKLANESAHIESEAGEHDLNAFQAIRQMDEILVKNFMIFQNVVEAGNYDVVIADEAWDVDHFWHEHPEMKLTQMAWLTDFVGWVPMAENGPQEAILTTDYNAEMIEHVERHSGVRDRAIFVGNRQDIVPFSFGENLPQMRDWIPRQFDFSGYVMGMHPSEFATREALRSQFGFEDGEKVCIVTVGGSGVGGALVRRILAAYPAAKRRIPELRMIVVTGPRLDPAQFALPAGVEARAFVADLDQQLAACDLALVQGGLTTCMELVAAHTPFLYFPLRNHFEQNFHVAHRLEQYDAGRKMIFDESCPERIAQAMVEELSLRRPEIAVEADGAACAARMISQLL